MSSFPSTKKNDPICKKFFFFVCFLSTIFFVACSTNSFYVSPPDFAWPVKRKKVTQKYKTRFGKHEGIDIAGPKNTPIHAAADGLVLYAGRDFTGYGKLIIIEHPGNTWASFYAHLHRFQVQEGQKVKRGQLIGQMGNTGRSSGVHLHFEIRYNLNPVDPMEFLPH